MERHGNCCAPRLPLRFTPTTTFERSTCRSTTTAAPLACAFSFQRNPTPLPRVALHLDDEAGTGEGGEGQPNEDGPALPHQVPPAALGPGPDLASSLGPGGGRGPVAVVRKGVGVGGGHHGCTPGSGQERRSGRGRARGGVEAAAEVQVPQVAKGAARGRPRALPHNRPAPAPGPGPGPGGAVVPAHGVAVGVRGAEEESAEGAGDLTVRVRTWVVELG